MSKLYNKPMATRETKQQWADRKLEKLYDLMVGDRRKNARGTKRRTQATKRR